jgi:hypothetical protein
MKPAVMALLLGSLSVIACDDRQDPVNATPAPNGYSNLVVFLGDGTWDPADPNFTAPTMEEVQREKWGFSDAEIQQYEADAKAFFVERFGLDVDDPANADRLLWTPYAADPRMRYRVVSMANHVVPAEGWPVTDSAFLLSVVDPAGFELGGEFAGVMVPVGTRVTYGRYWFDTGEGDPISIDFRSIHPYGVDAFGVIPVRCELSSEQLGSGIANATGLLSQEPGGNFSLSAGNVLTFFE